MLNRKKRQEAEELAQRITYVETAVDLDFQEEFVKAIQFPHATDTFPHIAEILPKATAVSPNSSTRRRRRRRRAANNA